MNQTTYNNSNQTLELKEHSKLFLIEAKTNNQVTENMHKNSNRWFFKSHERTCR